MSLALASVFNEYPNPFYVVRPILQNGTVNDFAYVYVNDAFCIFLGRSREELLERCFSDVFGCRGEQFWLDLFGESAFGRRHKYVNNDSTMIQRKLFSETFHVEPDLCGCIIYSFQEMAAEPLAERDEEMLYRANYDFLTGFYNRYYLRELNNEFHAKENVGVTYVDINDLKKTNDTFGHAAGDKLILQVTELIRAEYSTSLIFRVGGDEFVILTLEQTQDDFLQHAQNTQKLFESRNNIAAIGYCYYNQVTDLDVCIDQCDTLMYQHKKQTKASAKKTLFYPLLNRKHS